MKKRMLSILLTAAMVISAAGCGSRQQETSVSGTAQEEPAEGEAADAASGNESDLIVYTQKTMNQYFHVALQEKVEEAVTASGFKVEVTN